MIKQLIHKIKNYNNLSLNYIRLTAKYNEVVKENEELKKEIEHLSYNLDVVNNNFYYLHNKLQEERSKNYNKMVVEESKEETKFDFISDDTL